MPALKQTNKQKNLNDIKQKSVSYTASTSGPLHLLFHPPRSSSSRHVSLPHSFKSLLKNLVQEGLSWALYYTRPSLPSFTLLVPAIALVSLKQGSPSNVIYYSTYLFSGWLTRTSTTFYTRTRLFVCCCLLSFQKCLEFLAIKTFNKYLLKGSINE